MPSSLAPTTHAALDACIDALLAGADWHPYLPAGDADRAEVLRLVAVAERLVATASLLPCADASWKQATWRKLTSKFSIIRTIAFYRLPYLPPLWIKPEAF
jgi:hypothetical protein